MSEVKSKFSSYLKDVQRGETVLIFDRNRLVARMEPVNNADFPDADRVKALVRSGVASAPRRQLDIGTFLGRPRPKLTQGATAAGAVVRDRDGR